MRIEVADNNDGDRRGRRDRGEMNRDRTDGPDRTLGDWRSRPKEESVPDHDDRGSGFGRDRDGKTKCIFFFAIFSDTHIVAVVYQHMIFN